MKFKLRMKVFLALGVPLLVLLISNTYLIVSNKTVSRQNADIRDKIYKSYKITLDWSNELDKLAIELNNAVELGNLESLDKALSRIVMIKKNILKLKNSNPDEIDKIKRVENYFNAYVNISKQMTQALAKGDDVSKIADQTLEKETNFKNLKTELKKLKDEKLKNMYNNVEVINNSLERATSINIFIICVFFIVMFLIGFWTDLSLIKPVSRIVQRLRDIVDREVALSENITGFSMSMAKKTSEQALSSKEVSSSLEEITTMIAHNADNSTQAKQLSMLARESAKKGVNSVRITEIAMDDICSFSEEVVKINKVIESIAFQTNLLALNASVEASRAGENGQGFAVVAEEVRNLAQRTGAATKEISRLLEENVSKVKEGSVMAGNSGNAINDIVANSEKAVDVVSKIASASKEQASALNMINTAVAEIDMLTQDIASASEETASSATELNTHSENLKDIVRTLTSIVGD
ncbi:MAG: methyl-accepting chemotaxis protein [Desulfobacteraceae bacterium]|nr:methyl-accepting chemotaxis protein [Desulfobacteraceae bacterium]